MTAFHELFGLGGGLIAACEVGKGVRRLEAAAGNRHALGIRAVTGNAGGLVDLLAGCELRLALNFRLCLERDGKQPAHGEQQGRGEHAPVDVA